MVRPALFFLTPPEAQMDETTRTTSPKPGILVVDDEESLRSMLDMLLRESGFAVFLASNGREAVEVYQEHHKEIALVLSDVQMPDLDGPAMLIELQKIKPGVLCCFIGGDLGPHSEAELIRHGAKRVFPKPVQFLELVSDLRLLLAQVRREFL